MAGTGFSRDELQHFFDILDECLEEPATVVLVGGSAVILAYGVTTTTLDIDTFNNSTAALEEALQRAREKTELAVPVTRSGVAQAPEGYEERMVRQPTRGNRLELFVLERHDLAISKALRADERDRQHVVAMHEAEPFDYDTLVSRFENEMLPIYVGDHAPIIDYFLWVIEELFGEAKAAKAERSLKRSVAK